MFFCFFPPEVPRVADMIIKGSTDPVADNAVAVMTTNDPSSHRAAHAIMFPASILGASSHALSLVVTPELTVPTELLKTKPLDRLIEERILDSASLVDAGGVMPHDPSEEGIEGWHPHGFIAAAVSAFANHYPLALRPQHFWLMILQAIATHVELNAEELRSKWVAHEGKKELVHRTRGRRRGRQRATRDEEVCGRRQKGRKAPPPP